MTRAQRDYADHRPASPPQASVQRQKSKPVKPSYSWTEVNEMANFAMSGQAPSAAVQRRIGIDAGHVDDPAHVRQVAGEGISGSGTALPHHETIASSFGSHASALAGVSAHVGGKAAEASSAMGAEAYASGNHVAFANAPDLHLAAHEAAHVVQQKAGVSLSGGVGQSGDMYEQHADAVADAVTQGKSAEPILDRLAGGSAQKAATQMQARSAASREGSQAHSTSSSEPVQFFKDFPSGGAKDKKGGVHWKANAADLRVSDDGTMAVGQESIAGSQEAYLLASRVSTANSTLATAKAPFRLKTGSGSVKGAIPKDLEQAAQTLTQIEPYNLAAPKAAMETPDDCGDAARTVTGTFAEGKQLKGSYKDKAGTTKATTHGDPELMKYEIMLEHFAAAIPDSSTILSKIIASGQKKNEAWDKLEPFVPDLEAVYTEINAANEDFRKAKTERDTLKAAGEDTTAADAALKAAVDRYKAAKKEEAKLKDKAVGGEKLGDILTAYFAASGENETLVAAVMKPYEDLPPLDKEKFDQKAAINRFADPEVGQAYTISSGGDAKKDSSGDPITTWNFHWGGVVLKSTTGSDNVTLENYAGSARTDWVMQMYGVPTKDDERKGQTFQEQHRDVHEQHGEKPTTMTADKQ